MNLLILLEKINNLSDSNSRKIFLEFYELKDFNTMFRQTATRPENLAIADFLYLNKDEFRIDVNAKGKSQKNALDFAIEKNSIENVLFLLKLKETQVDDRMRDKINNKFGQNFRTLNIAPHYVPLGDKLISMNSRVEQYTLDYSKILPTLVEELKNKTFKNLEKVKSIGSADQCNGIRQSLLRDMKNFVDNYLIELAKLSNELDNFEDLFNQYLPYSYAQEKVLQGNEFAKSNLNSSMKNTCLHNRKYLGETAAAVHHNKMAILSNFNEVMQLFILNLVLFEQQSTALINSTLKKDDSDPDPQITKLEFFEPSQENQLSPDLSTSTSENLSNISASFDNFSQKSAKKIHSKAIPQKEPSPQKPSTKLANLTNLCDELNQLKQKGQVKLSAFQSIIKSISKEIDLQIKTTKKGFMVSQSKNHFSFHRPHEDKGVDKAAVQSLKDLVEENMQAIAKTSIGSTQ